MIGILFAVRHSPFTENRDDAVCIFVFSFMQTVNVDEASIDDGVQVQYKVQMLLPNPQY